MSLKHPDDLVLEIDARVAGARSDCVVGELSVIVWRVAVVVEVRTDWQVEKVMEVVD